MEESTRTASLREHETWWARRRNEKTFLDRFPRVPVFTRLAELVSEKAGSALDCGCGVCAAYPYLKEKNIKYTGIDFTEKFLVESRRRYPEIDVRYGTVLSLPFSKKTFDVSFCLSLLEHLHPDDLETCVSEMLRVAKKRTVFEFFRAPTPRPMKSDWHGYYSNLYNKQEFLHMVVKEPRVKGFNIERLGKFAFYVVDLW